MELRYYLEKEDYVAFNLYHAKHSKVIKRTLVMCRLVGPLLFLGAAFVFSQIHSELKTWYVSAFSVMSVIWLVVSPNYFYRSLEKNTMRLLNEGRNENMLGLHSFIVTDEGFTEKNKAEESTVKWSRIEKVRETKEHYFIFTSEIKGYIVPKQAFENVSGCESFEIILRENLPQSVFAS